MTETEEIEKQNIGCPRGKHRCSLACALEYDCNVGYLKAITNQTKPWIV